MAKCIICKEEIKDTSTESMYLDSTYLRMNLPDFKPPVTFDANYYERQGHYLCIKDPKHLEDDSARIKWVIAHVAYLLQKIKENEFNIDNLIDALDEIGDFDGKVRETFEIIKRRGEYVEP